MRNAASFFPSVRHIPRIRDALAAIDVHSLHLIKYIYFSVISIWRDWRNSVNLLVIHQNMRMLNWLTHPALADTHAVQWCVVRAPHPNQYRFFLAIAHRAFKHHPTDRTERSSLWAQIMRRHIDSSLFMCQPECDTSRGKSHHWRHCSDVVFLI